MHLIAPISFRAGKAFPWKNNLAFSNYNNQIAGGSALSQSIGMEQALAHTLAPHHLFPLRGVVRYNAKTNVWLLNFLYVPRIKESNLVPHVSVNTEVIDKWIYSARMPSSRRVKSMKSYFFNAMYKRARLRLNLPVLRIGKWVSQRLFRGTAVRFWRAAPARRLPRRIKKYIKKHRTFSKKHLLIQNVARRLSRKTRRQFATSTINFSDRLLSPQLSATLHRKIKVTSMNAFTYLLKKGVLSFKNHQRHFWNSAYRGRRWTYSSYWDIVNAFYLIGTIKHTEHLLLSLLRSMLQTVEKPRRVFYFLDAVIKNLPQIRKRFSCFRFTIVGKLAGGTKRTKYFTIGYGRLVVNSLSQDATNNFDRFAHRFGEFGLSLIMCRCMPTNLIQLQHDTPEGN